MDAAFLDDSSTERKQDPETYAILGAAMEVHRQLGRGFLEAVYHEALAFEFSERHIPAQHEAPLPVYYKSKLLSCRYRADFVCFNSVLVELKALERLSDNDVAQVLNYLKATGLRRALLINFGARHLECRRVVLGSVETKPLREESGPRAK